MMNIPMKPVMFATALSLVLLGCKPGGPAQEQAATTVEQEAKTMTEETTAAPTADPLTGTRWWVEDIAGGGVIDNSRTTVEFVEPGRVGGAGGCNRYMGSYERDGEDLSFGPLAGTMMACPEALMNQEQRFLEAMGEVTAWRIDERTQLLHLLDAAGETVVRASRLEEDDPAAG